MNMNLVGRRFGRLEVFERLDQPDERGELPKPSYYSNYMCRCDCGGQTRATYYALFRGKTSCGCQRIPKRMDITGRRFGSLTAIKPIMTDGDGRALRGDDPFLRWECRCDCGQSVAVYGLQLVAGVVSSCGCVKTACVEPMKRGGMRNNTSGVNGVSYSNRNHSRYRATIGWRGTHFDLGCYDSLEQAKAMRLRAEQLLFDPSTRVCETLDAPEASAEEVGDDLDRRMLERSAQRAEAREYPLDAEMIEFLNNSPDARRQVWEMMMPAAMTDDDRTVVGKRVKQIRIRAGLSIRDFAGAANLGRTYLGNVEKGLSRLTEEAAARIAGRFENLCSAEWLLYGIERQSECPYSPEMNEWLKTSCELRKLVRLVHELSDAPQRRKKSVRKPMREAEGWSEDAAELAVLGQTAWGNRYAEDWTGDYTDDAYGNLEKPNYAAYLTSGNPVK